LAKVLAESIDKEPIIEEKKGDEATKEEKEEDDQVR